ncbi:MAG: ferrous iron transport protein A [Rhodospirillales bacterium]|nr:ferrous iron transport protein A [Rhodospirillales bacterium]
MTLTIGQLAIGDRGRVVRLEKGDRGYRQRLLAMGLTPGTEFSILRVAPLGDPVELTVRGTAISLRRAEAALLQVERI